LRRRFAFVDLAPKLESPKFRNHLLSAGISTQLIDIIINRINALNGEIISDVTNLGPGFAIGHSFFCDGPADGEDGVSWYRRIVRTEVLPLLKEYWFDARTKVTSCEEQLLAPL
jgi:hypothetical protein